MFAKENGRRRAKLGGRREVLRLEEEQGAAGGVPRRAAADQTGKPKQ